MCDISQIAMNENKTIVEASAFDYVEHAIRINNVARTLLRLESRDADWLAGKISLGLSLQSVELVGKGMLRALGCSVEDIRSRHGKHNLIALLRQVEKKLQRRPESSLSQYHHFLTRTPNIDGRRFGTTIGTYFKQHFAAGPSARPRSYFYPDVAVFTGPVPIHALLVMADDIIVIGQDVLSIVVQTEKEKPLGS